MLQPTARQRDILDFMHATIRQRGYGPTLREIGKKFEIKSTNGVTDHMKALERKGYVVRGERPREPWRPVHVAPPPLPIETATPHHCPTCTCGKES